MRTRFHLLLVFALASALAIFIWTTYEWSPSKPVTPPETANTGREATDTSLLPNGTLEEPRTIARQPSPELETRATSRETSVFVYEDGTPASGLALCIVLPPPEPKQRWFVDQKPIWAARTGEDGSIGVTTLRTLGDMAVIRLQDAGLYITPLSDQPAVYQVPSLRQAELRFNGMPANQEVSIQLTIESMDLHSFGISGMESWLEEHYLSFADAYSVALGPESTPLLLARSKLDVRSPADRASVTVPRGIYSITPTKCTFGWWIKYEQSYDTSALIVVLVYKTPIVELDCINPENGALREPRQVVLVHQREGQGQAKSVDEKDVPWEARNGQLLVSMVGQVNESFAVHSYGLAVYWNNGTRSVTPLLPWEAMTGFFAFEQTKKLND